MCFAVRRQETTRVHPFCLELFKTGSPCGILVCGDYFEVMKNNWRIEGIQCRLGSKSGPSMFGTCPTAPFGPFCLRVAIAERTVEATPAPIPKPSPTLLVRLPTLLNWVALTAAPTPEPVISAAVLYFETALSRLIYKVVRRFSLLIAKLSDRIVNVQRCRLYALGELLTQAEFYKRSSGAECSTALLFGQVLQTGRQTQNVRCLRCIIACW